MYFASGGIALIVLDIGEAYQTNPKNLWNIQ